MAKNNRYEMNMCEGSILKKMLIFALPLMLSSMLQLLFNAADIIVVGKFCGDNALAAVGSNGALINLLTNVFMGLSVGSNVLVAKYYGADNKEAIHDTVHTSVILSFFSGLLLLAVGEIFARQLLVLMQTPEAILDQATLYLRIYFLGMPAMLFYNFGSAMLRAVGDTKRPLYFLTLAGIINVILNLLLVIVFKLDVAGVAIATVSSQTISAGLVLMCFIRNDGAVKLNIKELKVNRNILLKILRVGLPAGLQGTVFSLSNVVIQSSVNLFGEIVVSGSSAAANIEGFVYVAMNAFHHATLSFTGQNYGAGKNKRVLKILLIGEACVFVTGLILGQATYRFGRQLLSIYTDTSAAIDAGMIRLAMVCGTYYLCGMMDVIVGSLRGLGYAVMPMIVSMVGACGLRLLWLATVFQIPQYHTLKTVFVSYPVSWAITTSVHVICFVVIYLKKVRGSTKPNRRT